MQFFSPETGARGVQRLLEEKFLQPLMGKLLFADDNSLTTLNLDGGFMVEIILV